MEPLHAQDIRGSWATVLLPINEDESIDMARLAAEIDYLIAAGVHGMYTNGTAGEFYAQTEGEFDQIQMIVAERCEQGAVPFQIGASHMDPLIMLSRIRRAAQLAPAAIQIILPDWFPLSQEEQIDFLLQAADIADPVGLVLYNPPHAKRVLTPRELGVLAEAVPALVGVKTAGGDATWYQKAGHYAPQLAVFVPGHYLATGVSRGAQGAYSNVACLSPGGSSRWYDLMLTDMAAAQELEGRIQDFFAEYITPFIVQQGYANQAADKLLAAIGGWADVGTRLRRPYRWIPAEAADSLAPIARAMLPELFA
ncbi:MAG: dihydrodipicolinate synthase family protein [Caldilineaceae bacterium]|nr:dihydrodipicolinate synthase family protein [Caldilineaceae bacterium]